MLKATLLHVQELLTLLDNGIFLIRNVTINVCHIRCSLLTPVIRFYTYSNLKWIATCNALTGRCFFLATLAVRSSKQPSSLAHQHNSHTVDNIDESSRSCYELWRWPACPYTLPGLVGGSRPHTGDASLAPHCITSFALSVFSLSRYHIIVDPRSTTLPPASPPPPTVWVHT